MSIVIKSSDCKNETRLPLPEDMLRSRIINLRVSSEKIIKLNYQQFFDEFQIQPCMESGMQTAIKRIFSCMYDMYPNIKYKATLSRDSIMISKDVEIDESAINKIFAYWQKRTNCHIKMIPAHKQLIETAFEFGFSQKDIALAIYGATAKDSWHKKTGQTSLKDILKDFDSIFKLRQIGENFQSKKDE